MVEGSRGGSGPVGGKMRDKDTETGQIHGVHSPWYVVKRNTDRSK